MILLSLVMGFLSYILFVSAAIVDIINEEITIYSWSYFLGLMLAVIWVITL